MTAYHPKASGTLHAGLKAIRKRRMLEEVQIDFVTVSPVSSRGYKYVLSVVDRASGRVRFLKFKDRNGLEVARRLYEQVFLERGALPMIIHSDNGKEFVQDAMENSSEHVSARVIKKLQIK